jgi:hypothetical protein
MIYFITQYSLSTIFNFFITLFFLIRQVVKVSVKIKYLKMKEVYYDDVLLFSFSAPLFYC